VTIESEVLSLRISNRGGVLESVRLREYDGLEGEMLELIDAEIGATAGWPLALATGDPAIDAALEDALFVVEEGASEIRLEYARGGLRAAKVIRVDPTTYRLDISAEVTDDGREVPFSIVWQGEFGDQSREHEPGEANVVYRDGSGFDRLNAGDIEDPNGIPATAYIGVEDRYFAAVFLLSAPRPPRAETVGVESGEETVATAVLAVPYESGLGLYIGPQQEERLSAVDMALPALIDYGFFEILARPFLFGLAAIDGFVDNFGWSIIILTVLINFVFFPLRLKQQLSMQKMQKIQPQMRTLQDKFKKLKPNDPRRPEVQAEMMGLYKKNGVNPLGGCVPLLLQMPFLIAIFALLQVAVELRQASWLWVPDLSLHDPVYALPIVFGISMLIQQRMMPTVGDPMQARIMMLMPVMLTVFFIRSQAGLMLYWTTSTVFGVGQQYLVRKYWAPPTPTEKAKKREDAPIDVPAETVEQPAESSGASGGEGPADGKRRRRRKK
jgi:YidC/Oxa1 family membrane protein insertase